MLIDHYFLIFWDFSILEQLSRNGKSALMMGDDTWMQLFPDHFDKSYPYPSFNVKDLDTVRAYEIYIAVSLHLYVPFVICQGR